MRWTWLAAVVVVVEGCKAPTPPAVVNSTGACASDDECSDGRLCINNECRPPCTADTDCDADRVCVDRVCAPKVAPTITFTPSSLLLYAGDKPVEIAPAIAPGPQADHADIVWEWIVAPDGFDLTPPTGPSFVFTPDVVGAYALQVHATARGGSSSNLLVIRVDYDGVVAVVSDDRLGGIQEITTDGRRISAAIDLGVLPLAGLRRVDKSTIVYVAETADFFGVPNGILDQQAPAPTGPQGSSGACASSGGVWAIASGTAMEACCPAGSDATLGVATTPSLHGACCLPGYTYHSDADACEVLGTAPKASLIAALSREAERTTATWVSPAVLAGPAHGCAWSDIPPTLDATQVAFCAFKLAELDVSAGGADIAFVVTRIPTSNTTFATAVIVVPIGDEVVTAEPIDGGLPDPKFVLLDGTELGESDTYFRLAFAPEGLELLVVSGPVPPDALYGSTEPPGVLQTYHFAIYDPATKTSAFGYSAPMRASWKATALLMANRRIAFSSDGTTTYLTGANAAGPLATLWEDAGSAQYALLPEADRPALACAGECNPFPGSVPPFADVACDGDPCCTCLKESGSVNPVATCTAAQSGGKMGVAILEFDGMNRNRTGSKLSAVRTTHYVTDCMQTLAYAGTGSTSKRVDLVTYDVPSATTTAYDLSTALPVAPGAIVRAPASFILADDRQLGVSLRSPTGPPQFWVMNVDSSRPRQLLSDTVDAFATQTREPPASPCNQMGSPWWWVLALLSKRPWRFRQRFLS